MADHRYTHGHHESVLRSHRRRTAQNSCGYLLPHLSPGMRLLDVGSGPGNITADLARIVAPEPVLALETDEATAALTRDGLTDAGVDGTVLVGDVHRLDLPDDHVDVTHAHQVLQHVADPVQALREMARVTRPGGIVAVRDADYAGFHWWPRIPELDTWLDLYRRAARANVAEPDAGRRLLSWAHEAGLHDIAPSASVWCMATPEDRQWWGGLWADRIRESALADQLLAAGWTDRDGLQAIADAWLTWADDEDGWLLTPHGELLITVPG